MKKNLNLILLLLFTLTVAFIAQFVWNGNFDFRSRASQNSSSAYEFINTKVSSEANAAK